MHRLLLSILLLSIVISAAPPAAKIQRSPVWFQHIQRPMPLNEGQGEKIASVLRSMLLEKKSIEEILKAMPDDPNPRIIFIALGDGEWPERITFDTGETFQKALKNTLLSLQEKERKYADIIREQQKILTERAGEKPILSSPSWKQKLQTPNQWNSLRITIVQKSRQYENFSIALSKILLTNLNGIAFPRSAGFAFTPEQMTGRYLITPEHYFNSNQIGNVLSESENFQSMSTWLKLTTSVPPFPVILFDCASFHADATGAVRLFHCHSTAPVKPTPDSLLKLAAECGRSLLPALRADGGLKSPFPEWISSIPGGEHPAMLAGLSIAYSRLHAETGDQTFAQAAAKINRGLLNRLKTYRTSSGKYQCIVEKEILDNPLDPQDPRKIADTRTSAMAALAFIEYTGSTGNREFMTAALALIRHLTNVQRNSGAFRPVFIYPAMKPPAENPVTMLSETELTALASLVMVRWTEVSSESRPELALDQRILRSRNNIVKKLQKITGLHEMPPSLWITEYLSAADKDNRKEILHLLGRIAIAANLNLETNPVLPDLFGSIQDYAGMTLSAERSWLTAASARHIFSSGQEPQAAVLLSACWMQVMFQLHGFMDRATSAPLPQPDRYYGFFRDNLDSFSFNLNGQTTQILSLLNLRKALILMKQPVLQPGTPETAADWRKCQEKIRNSPVFLTADLIINNARSPESIRKISGNIQGTTTTTRFQGRGGKIMGASRNPSGTVLKTGKQHRKSSAAGLPEIGN